MSASQQKVKAAAEWARSNAHKHITSAWEGDYTNWHAIAKGMVEAAEAVTESASVERNK